MQISKVSYQVQKTLLVSQQIYKFLGILNANFTIQKSNLIKMTKSLRKKTLQTNNNKLKTSLLSQYIEIESIYLRAIFSPLGKSSSGEEILFLSIKDSSLIPSI